MELGGGGSAKAKHVNDALVAGRELNPEMS